MNAGLSECKAYEAWTPGGGMRWPGPPECANSGLLLNGPWADPIATPPSAKRAGKEPTNGWAWQRVRGPREKRVLFSAPCRLAEVGCPAMLPFPLVSVQAEKLSLPAKTWWQPGGSRGGPSQGPALTPLCPLTARWRWAAALPDNVHLLPCLDLTATVGRNSWCPRSVPTAFLGLAWG